MLTNDAGAGIHQARVHGQYTRNLAGRKTTLLQAHEVFVRLETYFRR